MNERNALIFAVRDALKQSFRESIEGTRPDFKLPAIPFEQTKVAMPEDGIWTRYAIAAVKAYERETGRVP